MDIKYFKLVKTIAEEGNIAKSSEKLFLTQSALSHQLKELEDRLGFKLFIRKRTHWILTEEGKSLYKLSNEVIDTIAKGFDEIQKISNGSKGRIRLSTECYSFYFGLSSFIQKMGLLYPAIDIEMVLGATQAPIPKILSNDIDLAIVTVKPEEDELAYEAIIEDEIFALLHVENELADQPYLKQVDFEKLHLIIHSYPLETVSIYQHYLKPNNIMPRKLSAIPLTEVALELVNANMGVMCMPKWGLKSFKLSDEIVFKQISEFGLKRTHYLVYRKEDKQKQYLLDFITNFNEEFS